MEPLSAIRNIKNYILLKEKVNDSVFEELRTVEGFCLDLCRKSLIQNEIIDFLTNNLFLHVCMCVF